MSRPLPALSDLLQATELPDELGPFKDTVAPLFDRLFYDNLRLTSSPHGERGRIDLDVVSWERLELAIGGDDGIALVLQPDRVDGQSSVVELSMTWRWPVLGLADRLYSKDLPTTLAGWFNLVSTAFGIDPRLLINDLVYGFFGGDDPLAGFVGTMNSSLTNASLALPTDPTIDPQESIFQQLAAIDPDVGALVVNHVIESFASEPTAQLAMLAEVLQRWTGSTDPEMLKQFFVPVVSAGIRRLAMALEVPRSWLTPLAPDGTPLPAPAQSQLLVDAGRLEFSTQRGVRLRAPGGFSLERAAVLGTGLTVEVQGATPAIGIGPPLPAAVADGRPGSFVGIYVEEAAIGLPIGWLVDEANSTAEIYVSNFLMGTGGVTGTIGLRGNGGALGDGETAAVALSIGGPNGVAVSLDHVDLSLVQNQITRSSFAGSVIIPGLSGSDGSPSVLTMSGAFGADGHHVIETTGEVYLGPDVCLGPIGNAPILRVEVVDGTSDTLSFDVHGQLRVPCADEPGCVRAIEVAGTLSISRSAGGDWSIEHAAIASGATGLSWNLPGGITVEDVAAAISWSDTNGFSASFGGRVAVGGGEVAVRAELSMPNPADPTDVVLDGQLTITDTDLGGALHVIDGSIGLYAATRPAPSGTVSLLGSCGLLPDASTPSSPGVLDFDVAVENLHAQFTFGPAGVGLELADGTVLLPAKLGPGAPTGSPPGTLPVRPTAEIATDAPIVATFAASGASLDGAVIVSGLGVTFDNTFTAELTTARLSFSSTQLPRLTEVGGTLTIPLPDGQTLSLVLSNAEFALDGLPAGQIALGQTVDIALGDGFALRVAGGADADGDIATGISVTREANGNMTVRIDASLLVVIPSDSLALEAGGEVAFGGAGHVIVSSAGPPIIGIEQATIGGTFRLGGANGLHVKDGLITVTGLDHLLAPTTANPVTIDVTGLVSLPNDGPGLGLRGAQFVFDGSGPPAFDLQGFDVAPGALLSAGGVLPIQLESASVTFKQQLPFPARLAATNVVITLTGGLQLPLGDGEGIGGQVKDLEISFAADGTPELSMDGIALGITGVELGILEIGGQIYIGGLSDLSKPENLFFAGKVGGKLYGAGVEVLAAFRLTGPIGGCIDVSLGPAGIPLGQTGILLTGVSGGVSFANTGGDPCDFRSYVQLDADGRPADNPAPVPSGSEPPLDPHAQPPGGPADVPPQDELEFPAPGTECPPPSMNILAEPHPDAVLYPDAVIYKFTALDEATVNNFGITRELVASWGLSTPAAMANSFAAAFRSGVESLWPPVPTDLTQVIEAQNAALDAIESLLATAAEAAFTEVRDSAGGANDVYEAVVALAWAGIPVQDITVKLTGTFSYVGVSAFLSVTGGIVLSTTGAAGIIGSLNLFGIPVGTFRGFVTATDADGLPNPSLCGEINVAIGPLELGSMRMSVACPGGVTGIAQAVVDFTAALSDAVVADAIARVAPEVHSLPTFSATNPHASLSLLSDEQIVALVGEVVTNPPRNTAAYFAALTGLLDDVWDNFNPEVLLAGSVQPKLFGLALAPEAVAVSAYATKTELAGQFRFSPSFIVNYFLGGILPAVDAATMGFKVTFPDPKDAIMAGLTGAVSSTEELVDLMEDGLEHVLGNATFTISYSIAPLGLELADAQARVILPELDDHPDRNRRQVTEPRRDLAGGDASRFARQSVVDRHPRPDGSARASLCRLASRTRLAS